MANAPTKSQLMQLLDPALTDIPGLSATEAKQRLANAMHQRFGETDPVMSPRNLALLYAELQPAGAVSISRLNGAEYDTDVKATKITTEERVDAAKAALRTRISETIVGEEWFNGEAIKAFWKEAVSIVRHSRSEQERLDAALRNAPRPVDAFPTPSIATKPKGQEKAMRRITPSSLGKIEGHSMMDSIEKQMRQDGLALPETQVTEPAGQKRAFGSGSVKPTGRKAG